MQTTVVHEFTEPGPGTTNRPEGNCVEMLVRVWGAGDPGDPSPSGQPSAGGKGGGYNETRYEGIQIPPASEAMSYHVGGTFFYQTHSTIGPFPGGQGGPAGGNIEDAGGGGGCSGHPDGMSVGGQGGSQGGAGGFRGLPDCGDGGAGGIPGSPDGQNGGFPGGGGGGCAAGGTPGQGGGGKIWVQYTMELPEPEPEPEPPAPQVLTFAAIAGGGGGLVASAGEPAISVDEYETLAARLNALGLER